MADFGRRRGSHRRPSVTTRDSSGDSSIMGKSTKERKQKKPKERWLLTRKTWRYMTDAGKKLIPDGALNRPEDVPKIEAYFQEVCQKQGRFHLWRKSSYPGALGFHSNRRRHRKGGSCRNKSNSADESDELARKKSDFLLAQHTSGGRFDLQKLRHDFLNKPTGTASASSSTSSIAAGGPSSSPRSVLRKQDLPTTREEDTDESQLIEMLGSYLKIHDEKKLPEKGDDKGGTFDYQSLIDKLQQHLNLMYGSLRSSPHASTSRIGPSHVEFEGDHIQKSLSETLSRYYSRSPNRQHVISDLLTDRKLLEKLYFDLRQTKGFRSTRTGAGAGYSSSSMPQWRTSLLHHNRNTEEEEDYDSYEDSYEPGSWRRMGKPQVYSSKSTKRDDPPMSPPPLIAIQSESIELAFIDGGIQTDPLSECMLQELEVEYKKQQAAANQEDGIKSPTRPGVPRRKSSVDHDDVSQSVSDTIKRYLRMARKKSVDSDKVDRFKRVNYDKNLRFIKAKGEITKPGDDDGLSKGCQTNEAWLAIYRELKFDEAVPGCSEPTSPSGDGDNSGSRMTSSRSSFETAVGDELLMVQPLSGQSSPQQGVKSPPSPASPSSPSGLIASGQSFLSHLLHGKAHVERSASTTNSHPVTAGAAAAMQKSKSSSSVMHHGSRLVAKKIWRSRSKSQNRAVACATSTWTPQGQCTWTNVTGRQVTLQDTTLLQLTEVERRVLQKVALAKLQAINLGVTVRLPSETATVASTKPKRRAYLLKRKALTTSFFDNARVKDGDKEKGAAGTTTGLVFGIPLNQCIENDRLARRVARGGSPFRSRSELSGDEPIDLRRQSHHGSRTSFSSLIDTARAEEVGSCESLMSRDRIGASVPGLLDTLSSSASDLVVTTSEDEPGIPYMVTACLRYLEVNGLNTLGIFRVSSSKKRVRQLREDFDSGKEVAIGEEQCPHDVATLLKEYLRDLPDPLLCRDLYHAFVQTQRIRNRRLQFEALQHLIQLLPLANRDTLWALLSFLACVAQKSDDQKDAAGEWIPGNKMDSNNLATVFAPNILHCVKQNGKEMTVERADERIDVINVIRSMIDHNRQLFVVSAELLDEVYTIMMETNPEALDQLLMKKDSIMIGDDIIDDLIDSESSTPRTPNAPGTMDNMTEQMMMGTHSHTGGDSDGTQTPPVARQVWSREEFLHGTAGMGGPNLAMRIRHKDRDRARDRFSKRRWRDESASRRQATDDMYDIIKSRSSSMDSGNAPGDQSDHSRALRITEEQRYSTTSSDSRRQSTPLLMDNANVITASLKIPLQPSNSGPLSLNLDDADIPYIEDTNAYTVTANGRQQMQIGILRGGPTAPPRRIRQRSVSGSDSSQGSLVVQPITGSLSLGQQAGGYDSAMGSSATFSSPPRNTPSSVGSSIAGDGLYSSPPSWASTPPTSPDSSHTTVNYIPDDVVQQTLYTRMTVPLKSPHMITTTNKAPNSTPAPSAVLQKVTFTSASELQQRPKHVEVHTYRRETSYQKEFTEVPKSASTSAVPVAKETRHEQKFSPSISSIGGAVLRSRTADFERMMRVVKTTESTATTTTSSSSTTTSTALKVKDGDKKKYVKRRYTDSRHQTRHIPDAETLGTAASSSADRAAMGGGVEKSQPTAPSPQQQGPIYKRRELIASVPKEKRSFF